MAGSILIYAGSAVIFVWGVAHLAATRPVVQGFGSLSADNHRVITMEWVLEGLTLCFLGVLAGIVELAGGRAGLAGASVIWACAGMLVAMAVVSGLTGARTSVVPMRLCPMVKSAVAVLFALGSLLP